MNEGVLQLPQSDGRWFKTKLTVLFLMLRRSNSLKWASGTGTTNSGGGGGVTWLVHVYTEWEKMRTTAASPAGSCTGLSSAHFNHLEFWIFWSFPGFVFTPLFFKEVLEHKCVVCDGGVAVHSEIEQINYWWDLWSIIFYLFFLDILYWLFGKLILCIYPN